jgi:hypothetical protein
MKFLMTKGSIMRRGRPSLDGHGPSTSFSVRLPPRDYDRIFSRARATRTTPTDWARHALTDALDGRDRLDWLDDWLDALNDAAMIKSAFLSKNWGGMFRA